MTTRPRTASILGALVLATASLQTGNLRIGEARAAVCDPGTVCTGDPCIVAGSYSLDEYCALDFTGRDVTISAGAVLSFDGINGGSAGITARNLTILGVVKASNSYGAGLDFYTDETFRVGPGSGAIYAFGPASTGSTYLTVVAAGDLILEGNGTFVTGTYGAVELTGSNVRIHSPIEATGGLFSEGDYINVTADNDIETTRRLRVNTNIMAFFQFSAGGNAFLDGGVQKAGKGAGYFSVDAGGDVRIGGKSKLSATPTKYVSYESPQIYVTAGGDVSIPGKVAAKAGKENGATIEIAPASNRNITVSGQIDARTAKSGSYGAIVSLGTACHADLTRGKILVDGHPTGELSISAATVDATRATLRSGASSPPQLTCRCIDLEPDGICDGGCATPLVLDGARFKPAPSIQPVAMAACP